MIFLHDSDQNKIVVRVAHENSLRVEQQAKKTSQPTNHINKDNYFVIKMEIVLAASRGCARRNLWSRKTKES